MENGKGRGGIDGGGGEHKLKHLTILAKK